MCGKYISHVNAMSGHRVSGDLLSHRVDELSDAMMAKRCVIYCSHSSGRFKTNRAVVQRFYRLNWGAWIRPRAGRAKHLWSKPYHIKWWAKQHVFCTDEHNKVLDQMVGAYYKRPTYFVDDPYEPYQKRHDFPYVPLGKNSVTTSYINTLYEYKSKR
ncbi:unnamed protein product [Oppiella nova]|uniref:Large ribosomal subunit protein bL35m n=1 Tax=Oppiella nova TaxID=334625 RepID=A0A7R9M382_9ACAR|nr:unnamed protein product [Oppiella nova]CAG2169728.1 unnamed protein product [Oppiella nova]